MRSVRAPSTQFNKALKKVHSVKCNVQNSTRCVFVGKNTVVFVCVLRFLCHLLHLAHIRAA